MVTSAPTSAPVASRRWKYTPPVVRVSANTIPTSEPSKASCTCREELVLAVIWISGDALHGAQRHSLEEQVWPSPHARSQTPQCIALLRRSTHSSPHSVWLHVGQAHLPPTQLVE